MSINKKYRLLLVALLVLIACFIGIVIIPRNKPSKESVSENTLERIYELAEQQRRKGIKFPDSKVKSLPRPRLSGPNPADGAIHNHTWVNLSWPYRKTATSFDVYFGDNLNDVNSGAEVTFCGNQQTTFFVAGFPGFPYPEGLVPETTYYWRIDEVNEAEPNSPWKGQVWSFTVPTMPKDFPRAKSKDATKKADE